MASEITLKKKHLLIAAAILVIGVFTIIGASATFTQAVTSKVTGNAVNTKSTPSNGEFQEVKLSFVNYEYQLEPSELKKDIPVRMTVDLNTVTGCMTDIRIPSFGVAQRVSAGNNIIEFTPDKSGTFNIACSMNMGRGTFKVFDSSGQVAAYQEPIAEGGSCSGSAGGCGGGCGR